MLEGGDKMKRVFVFMLLAFCIISSGFTYPQMVFAESISDNSVIILSGKVIDEDTIEIKANLTVNTGISGMTLELVYDKKALTLNNVVFGKALSSLEPITTNTKTNEGFSITPFIFNYFGKENDFTKGNLFTLEFKVKSNITDGNYKVALKYNKNKDVTYYDGNNDVKTKNLYIDNTEIEIKDNSVVKISSIKDNEKNSKIFFIVCIVLSSIMSVTSIILIVVLSKRKRNWKRL
jgi:hypothetical protein